MSKEESKVESLEELRLIDQREETDPIKKKLAELFSVSELDQYDQLLSPSQLEQQQELIESASETEIWFRRKIKEREEKSNEIGLLLDKVDGLQYESFQPGKELKHFSEVQNLIGKLLSVADKLIFTDDFLKSSELSEAQVTSLTKYFDLFSVTYDKKMIDRYKSIYSDSKSVNDQFQKIFIKIRVKKSKAAHVSVQNSILELQNELNDQLLSLTSTIIEQVTAITKEIGDDEVEEKEEYVETHSEFRQLLLFIAESTKDYDRAIIPDEFIYLGDKINEVISESRDKLKSNKKKKISELSDSSSLIHSAQEKILQDLKKMDIVLPKARQYVLSLVEFISEQSTSISSEFKSEMTSLLEERKYVHFLISRPYDLRKQLYDMYRTLELPKSERKVFLKQAINLMKELVETQTEAFFVGFSTVWESFQSVGLSEIETTELEIHREFFNSGYEINSGGAVDFVDALTRAKNSHNKLVGLLSTQLDIEHSSETELGTLLFKAYAKGRYLDPASFPYGVVRLDTTPPVTSIRLICDDSRDYGFVSRHLSKDDYRENKIQKTISGGASYANEQRFIFDNNNVEDLSLTVINGSNSDEEYQKVVVRHEDAHQAIIIKQSQNRTEVSAESRKTNSLSQDFEFDELTLSYEQSEVVSTWRDKIRPQIDKAVIGMRDETQAYLTGGTDVKIIKGVLSRTDKDALYDYVCNFQFRSSEIDSINKNKKFTDPNERDYLIKIFKSDVLKVKAAYDKKREKYLSKVSSVLDRFLQDDEEDVAKRKLGLLVRHTTPEEFLIITRYLKTGEKYKEKKAEKIEKSFNDKKIREKITLLSDEQLDKLLIIAEPELRLILLFIYKISKDIPGYIKDEIGSLEIPEKITLSREIVRRCFRYDSSSDKALEGSVVWTEKDIKEAQQYRTNKKDMKKSFLSDKLFINGKNIFVGLNLAMQKIWADTKS